VIGAAVPMAWPGIEIVCPAAFGYLTDQRSISTSNPTRSSNPDGRNEKE